MVIAKIHNVFKNLTETEQKIASYILEFPEKIIETSAKLVYTREKESHGKMYYVTALHFTTITPRNIDFIVKKCFLYQLRLKNME